MLPPLIQRSRRSTRWSRERGATMAIVAISLVAIIAMAALSIDVGTLYEAKAEAQRAADAAALAAARTISMQGLTGDPTNASSSWQLICGGEGSPASLAANNVAQQNLIGGAAASKVKVYYGTSGGVGTIEDCSTVGAAFGVNPVVQVYVQQATLPNFFARVFSLVVSGGTSNSGVSATATAEVFNPSNSNAYASSGDVVPVQPRCVKPWIVPNYDPYQGSCNTTNCFPFVSTANGALGRPGIRVLTSGVIGEQFWLLADCGAGATCTLLSPPEANYGGAHLPPNLQYLPGLTSFSSVAVPSDGSSACSAVAGDGIFAQAIAGCDQTTQYQCGVQSSSSSNPNQVNLAENPVTTDTTDGIECLIHQTTVDLSQLEGQDALLPTGGAFGSLPPNYPFQIEVGTSNPLVGAGAAGVITSSNSIVSLPIYDSTAVTTFGPGTTTPVTIIGFLQVFINVVDASGNMNVTVMNVSGCGNGTTPVSSPLNGTSPVPIRLITPPSP